jgi:hypothetical protein
MTSKRNQSRRNPIASRYRARRLKLGLIASARVRSPSLARLAPVGTLALAMRLLGFGAGEFLPQPRYLRAHRRPFRAVLLRPAPGRLLLRPVRWRARRTRPIGRPHGQPAYPPPQVHRLEHADAALIVRLSPPFATREEARCRRRADPARLAKPVPSSRMRSCEVEPKSAPARLNYALSENIFVGLPSMLN